MRLIMKAILVCAVLLLFGALVAACAGPTIPAVAPSARAAVPPVVSSAFKIENLTINPAVVNAGVKALITARVVNTSGTLEKYAPEVRVLDSNRPSLPAYLYPDEVLIPAGASQLSSVATTITSPGVYEVVWGSVSRYLTVNPEEAAPPRSAADTAPGVAPDFTGVDVVTGKTITLSQFKGSPVLLNFVNYGCDPGTNNVVSAQLTAIQKLKAQRSDLVPVSVFCGCCPPEVLRQFATENKFDWPWLLDTDYSIVQKYANYLKRYGYPTLVFVDRDMKIREATGYIDLAALTGKLNAMAPAGK